MPGLVSSGLVLNERGAVRALETSVHEVNVVVVSTDAFSERNSGMPTAEAVAMAARVAKLVAAEGRPVAVTLAAAFGCPFSGEVPVARVTELARSYEREANEDDAKARAGLRVMRAKPRARRARR